MNVAIVDGDVSYPATSGKHLRTLNLMLKVAQRHRITYIGLCADSDDAHAQRFFRDHGIEPILVHHPVPHKSGLAFYALSAERICFPPGCIRSWPIKVSRSAPCGI